MSSLKRFTRLLPVAGLLFFLYSCKVQQVIEEDEHSARDQNHRVFVQKNNFEIIETKEARPHGPLFGKAYFSMDNGDKLLAKEVRAYQDFDAYYTRTSMGWAPRIKKGLINVYKVMYTTTDYEAPTSMGGMAGTPMGHYRNHTHEAYWLQKGDSSEAESMTPKLVERYVQDYAPAREYIDMYLQTQKKVHVWSIINTAAVVGGLLLASTGFDHNSNLNATGYAGTGVFLGGLVNGVVNKIRKGKNIRNLGYAINEYDAQTPRKRR